MQLDAKMCESPMRCKGSVQLMQRVRDASEDNRCSEQEKKDTDAKKRERLRGSKANKQEKKGSAEVQGPRKEGTTGVEPGG